MSCINSDLVDLSFFETNIKLVKLIKEHIVVVKREKDIKSGKYKKSIEKVVQVERIGIYIFKTKHSFLDFSFLY